MKRFVIVAVEQHEVACAQYRVRNHFVRCACAVQNEVGPVRAENPCRILLRLGRRPFMD